MHCNGLELYYDPRGNVLDAPCNKRAIVACGQMHDCIRLVAIQSQCDKCTCCFHRCWPNTVCWTCLTFTTHIG
jgi:hypothetical protein